MAELLSLPFEGRFRRVPADREIEPSPNLDCDGARGPSSDLRPNFATARAALSKPGFAVTAAAKDAGTGQGNVAGRLPPLNDQRVRLWPGCCRPVSHSVPGDRPGRWTKSPDGCRRPFVPSWGRLLRLACAPVFLLALCTTLASCGGGGGPQSKPTTELFPPGYSDDTHPSGIRKPAFPRVPDAIESDAPGIGEPAVPQVPDTVEPDVPDIGEPAVPPMPDTVEPDAPGIGEPAVPQVPDTLEPDVPDIGEPAVPQVPDTLEPDVPDIGEPAVPQVPDTVEPDVPDIGEPAVPQVPEVIESGEPETSLSGEPRALTAFRFDPIVTLQWNPPADASVVPVLTYQYRVDGGPWMTTGGAQTSYVVAVSETDQPQTHTYQVRAVTDQGFGSPSNEVTVVPHAQLPKPKLHPVNLQAVGDDGSVLLTWAISESTDEESAVIFCLFEVDGDGIWRVTDSQTSHLVQGLQNDRDYQFQVKVVGTFGVSEPVRVSARTKSAPSLPDAPQQLKAVLDSSQVWTDLTWEAPLSDGGADINAYQYAVDGGAWQAMNGVRSFQPDDCLVQCLHGWSTDQLHRDSDVQVRAVNRVGPGPASDAAQVRSEPELSVADVTGREGDGALDFIVSLSYPRNLRVSVDYATADLTSGDNRAQAGLDYTVVSGRLEFLAGETSKTVRVPIIDDDIDDDGEVFELRLSNSRFATISDAVATGTISNHDSMPAAWLAHFGRSVAEHVVQGVRDRLQTARRGSGYSLPFAGDPGQVPGQLAAVAVTDGEVQRLQRIGGGRARFGGDAHETLRGTAIRNPVAGGTLAAMGTGKSSGNIALWGQGGRSEFKGGHGASKVRGTVVSTTLGIDWADHRTVAGFALSWSEGDGHWSGGGPGGEVEASLTGLYPYVGYRLSDRLSLWGMAGAGDGRLKLRSPAGSEALQTGIVTRLGAIGARTDLIHRKGTEGPALSVQADGLLSRMKSDSVPGMSASRTDASLLRLGLEASWRLAFEPGLALTPSIAFDLRRDGADGDHGRGMAITAGLDVSDSSGSFTAGVSGYALRTRLDDELEGWGVSGRARYDPAPSSDRGFAVSLRTLHGVQPSAQGAAAFSPPERIHIAQDGLLELGISYGLEPSLAGSATGPYATLGMSEQGRSYVLGWRFGPMRPEAAGTALTLTGTYQAPADDNPGDYAVLLRSSAGW